MTAHELTNLALQAGKGDTKALVSLVDHTFVDLRKIVSNRVPVSESDDIQQEIWLSLINYLPRYEGRSSFTTWFYSIILRRIADNQRRKYREIRHRQCIEEHIDRNCGHNYSIQTNFITDDILRRCPKIYREVLRLYLFDGMTFSEIGAKIGMSREATRSRYRRGIEWLQSNASRLGF